MSAAESTGIRTIGLVVHPHRSLEGALENLTEWAEDHDAALVQVPVPGNERVVAPSGDAAACDLIVALGGDGTTLAAMHAAAPHDKPVLGVACGSVGALTATSGDELHHALDRIAAGDWRRRRLPGVGVGLNGKDPHIAINDLVAIRKGANQVISDVFVDGELYARFAGDGVIIATPLGSSAYTMAAGGPILAAGTEAIVITPVAPHGGSAPPLVVGAHEHVRVVVDGGFGGARIEFDGHIKDFEPHVIQTSWCPDYVSLVRFDGAESALAGLRRRRIITDSPRVLARDAREARATEPRASESNEPTGESPSPRSPA
jgi:NAD+ kinase